MMKLTKLYSFIFGSRYCQNAGSEDDTIITLIGNKMFTLIGNIFFNLKISDILYTFVIGETKLARKLKLRSDDFKICVELPIKVINQIILILIFPVMSLKELVGKKS